jgi:phosphatidylglycerol lysyltransferase
MQKAKTYLSKLLYNKFFWQLILAAFMLGMAAFFIQHEHVELFQIREQLAESNGWYVSLGILLTGVYIYFQGLMYVHCFRALGVIVRLRTTTTLFLKRNLVSVFLPAGGFSSLAFFTKEAEREGATLSQVHLASTLFGLFSILSVVVVAFPVLGFALLNNNLQQTEIVGFIFLLALTALMIWLLVSISRKGKVYRWLHKVRPSLLIMIDEMISHTLNRKELWMTLIVSLGIEVIGIVHLYIAMLALGFEPSWAAAMIGYIVMVVLLIASPFLRGLGAIEVSLTYVLGQFGFPVIAAATITLLYRLFEFWLPLLAGIASFFTRKDNLLLRILPALIILVLGVVNMISAITPAIPTRLRLVRDIISEDVIVTGNAIVFVFGLLLLILSVFLLQGSKRAWYIGLFLTGFSVIGHLIKAVDYEEALLAFVAAGSLLYTRRYYKLKPHPKLTRISYQVLIFSVLALLTYSVVSFYFIDKRHFGTEFDLWTSTKIIFKMFFLFDESGLSPRTVFAQNFLYSIYASGGLVLSFVLFSLVTPYFSKPYNSEQDRALAEDIVKRYGRSALDYFKTYPDKFFFFADDRDGFISFKITRHFAFVLEDPVCKDESAFQRLVQNFDQFCNENGFVSIYYRIPGSSRPLYKALTKKVMPVGEEAIVDLTSYTLEGGKMKTTRSAINRLTSEGYSIKIYEAPVREGVLQKLEQVSNNWLVELQQKEVAFTQGVFDKTILKEQTIITVEDHEEKVHAFLNLVPDYVPGESTYDLIRKGQDAPNGVLDMLLAKSFLYLKEKGFRSVNMGLAPLSGIEGINLTEKTIRYAYDNLKFFAHFKGLRKYKDKFFPVWEKKYLAYDHNYHLLQVPNALKRVSEGS